MKDVTFGQYYPRDSFVHRLDPRMKFLFLIAYIVAIFLATNFYGLAVCTAVLIVIIALARVPFGKVLRSIRGILVLLIFTALLNILFVDGETDSTAHILSVRVLIESDVPRKRTSKPAALLMKVMPSIVAL